MSQHPELDARILAELELASEPLKRRALVERCGPWGVKVEVAERRVRESLERLVLAGHPVANSGKGFFLASTPDEFSAWIEERQKAVRSEQLKLNRLKAMRDHMTYRPRPALQNLFGGQP